jgi:hypothetical protein
VGTYTNTWCARFEDAAGPLPDETSQPTGPKGRVGTHTTLIRQAR